MTEKKVRRPRRTKVSVEKAVLDAVSSLIDEVGFSNITLKAIAQRAEIEASVFYRRYENLDQLFEDYTRKYDYWMGNLAEMMPSDLTEEEAFKWILTNLAKALYKNKGMQQLLIWELSDENPVTRRTARQREIINQSLLQTLEKHFEGTGVDINVITSIIISGVYYLILHQNISTFCNVDFSTKAGKDRLEATLNQLVSIFFSLMNQQKQQMEVVGRLRAAGVSEEIIKQAFQF